MLLTQTASCPPNFILIGAGLVWQTLPAGWIHTFESHYTTKQLQDPAEVLQAWRQWILLCRRQIDNLKADRAKLRHEHAVLSREAARSSFQRMFDTNQARANKVINNQGSKGSSVRALLDDQDQMVTSLDGCLELARAFYQKLATVPENCREGPLPWTLDLDSYTITTEASIRAPKVSILAMLEDPNRFARIIRNLSDKKAPGPDGIPNEVLKWLPEQGLDMLHACFVQLYCTGTAPDFMRESDTVPIHKGQGTS